MALALEGIKQFNAMPVYGMSALLLQLKLTTNTFDCNTGMGYYFTGLNVFSILKHEALVISLPALELLEEKLLDKLHSAQKLCKRHRPLPIN